MTTTTARLDRRSQPLAVTPSHWTALWETTAPAGGGLQLVAQIQALNVVTPTNGLIRVRNLTKRTNTATVTVFGLATGYHLPVIAVSTGDVVVIEAKPETVGQVHIGFAAGSIATLAATDTTPPVITGGQSFTVDANDPNSTLVGNIAATDNVGVSTMTIIAGNTGGAFTLANNGDLRVASQTAVAAQSSFSLNVQATDVAGNQGTGTVAVTVTPDSGVPMYAWEDRPAYVEPNPNATAGSPQKLKADELGITSRVVVSSVAEWGIARNAAVPGRQIYIDTTLVGNGTSQLLDWYGSKDGAGAGTSKALVGGGSAPDGTAANPIVITCAPGVWIDGGIADGVENTNSRCLTVRGTSHVWLYGANLRRANFVFKYDQCPGDPAAPMRVWYCKMEYSAHAMLHCGGYHTKQSGDRIGETNNVDIRYNELSYTGRGQRRFGEAIYIGYGSGTSYTTSQCHGITAVANYIHHSTAEACDVKPGCYGVAFNYNLVTDCDDANSAGANSTEGFPGSVQFMPASDSIYPAGYSTMPGGYQADCEAIGNRFFRITSASQKYPTAQILIGHRGVKVIGNYFVGCSVPGSPQIRTYIEDGQSFGTTGTIEIHNNTSKDARALWDHFIGGGSNATETTTANNNTNASNNVGTSSQTGVDLAVTAAAFGDDGSGYEGAAGAPSTGGALDVTGADTSALWDTDYAGNTVAAPVHPGAHQ